MTMKKKMKRRNANAVNNGETEELTMKEGKKKEQCQSVKSKDAVYNEEKEEMTMVKKRRNANM